SLSSTCRFAKVVGDNIIRLFTITFMFLGAALNHLGVPFLPAMALCFVLAFTWGMIMAQAAVSSDAVAARKIHTWLHAEDS
ncbi:MAG: hypothetical protein AB7K24_19115, partial [Gemmataceae bacterium]